MPESSVQSGETVSGQLFSVQLVSGPLFSGALWSGYDDAYLQISFNWTSLSVLLQLHLNRQSWIFDGIWSMLLYLGSTDVMEGRC